MKKRFISVLTALLCVWLAGCGHTDDPNLNKDTENGSTATDTMTGSDDILTDSELDGDTDTDTDTDTDSNDTATDSDTDSDSDGSHSADGLPWLP